MKLDATDVAAGLATPALVDCAAAMGVTPEAAVFLAVLGVLASKLGAALVRPVAVAVMARLHRGGVSAAREPGGSGAAKPVGLAKPEPPGDRATGER